MPKTGEELQMIIDNQIITRGGKIITAPIDARIHGVLVQVQQDQEWLQAVQDAGPDTAEDHTIWEAGTFFLPVGAEVVEEELILLNYPEKKGSWYKALAWSEQQGLESTVPREVFAVGDQHQNLHKELGCDAMYAIATTERTFGGHRRACSVLWYDKVRKAGCPRVSWFGEVFDCFVFRIPLVN
jgi:hypothetical protein